MKKKTKPCLIHVYKLRGWDVKNGYRFECKCGNKKIMK